MVMGLINRNKSRDLRLLVRYINIILCLKLSSRPNEKRKDVVCETEIIADSHCYVNFQDL